MGGEGSGRRGGMGGEGREVGGEGGGEGRKRREGGEGRGGEGRKRKVVLILENDHHSTEISVSNCTLLPSTPSLSPLHSSPPHHTPSLSKNFFSAFFGSSL